MYHPTIVQSRIEALLRAREVFYELPGGVKRFYEPTRHSLSEIDSSVRHLDSLVKEDGKLKRPLDEAEIAFISNERFLARLDYRYYAENYAFIQNAQGTKVRYKPWIPQRIVQDIVAEHDLNGWPIEFQFNKARQLGVSREISLMFGHRAIFYAGVNAVLASADDKKSTKLAAMMEYPIDHLPWWLAPAPTLRREGSYLVYGDHESAISIESGNQFNGLARGTTPNLVHLSELCDFLDPKQLVEAALFPAIHPTRWTFLVLESTSLGRGNWWHETWKLSVEGWPRGKSRLRPIFLPFFVGLDIEPTEDWARMNQQYIDAFVPDEETLRHVRACEAYARSNALLRKYLGPDWRMPKAQIFWYETKREEYREKGILNLFLGEYCSSADEAFQSTNISVFQTETISLYRSKAREEVPLGVFGLQTSPDIFPKRLQPAGSQIDPNAPAIDVKWTWGSGRPIEFTLQPLKWDGYSENDEEGNNKIFLFEMPDGHSEFGVGVDTGEGVGKDRSTCEVIRKGNVFRKAAQVAEYASPYLNSHDLWPITAALMALYATPKNGHLQQPRCAIECRGNGDTVQHELIKRGLYNWHPWTRIDNRTINPGRAHKIGVFTNNWFRKQVMDWLLVFLRDEKIEIHSPYFVTEMEALEADEFAQSLKAAYNEHDDRLMALGFVLVSMHQLEIGRGQGPEDQTVKESEDPVWTPPGGGLIESQQQFLQRMGAKRMRA